MTGILLFLAWPLAAFPVALATGRVLRANGRRSQTEELFTFLEADLRASPDTQAA